MKLVKEVLESTKLRLGSSLVTIGVLERVEGDTSVSLAMKHLASREEVFSLGDSNNDEEGEEAMAIVAT
jgi:hypothetical protein